MIKKLATTANKAFFVPSPRALFTAFAYLNNNQNDLGLFYTIYNFFCQRNLVITFACINLLIIKTIFNLPIL